MSLIDEAKQLPDDDSNRGGYSWHQKLDDATRHDVDEFIKAFWDGKLAAKFRSLRKAAVWLTEKVNDKCNLGVSSKTVEEHLRKRRP